VQEALRLADRVLVFSPSPGSVVQDLRVDLARPRSEASPAFIETLGELRQILRGETVKESQ
jgi:NitT/TauT family transport system ATP-binding protein